MRHSSVISVIAGVICCGLLCEAAQAGDVYKYVDDRGVTLYTDRPMPGAEKVSSGTTSRSPVATERGRAAQQTATNQQLTASNQRIAQTQSDSRAAATVARDLEATRADRCKKAREDYQTAIGRNRLYRTQEDGTRAYLSESEIAQQRLSAAKAVDSICGPQG
jgi:Domain of unknown function (DUF4124)